MITLVPLCTMTLTLKKPVDAGKAPTGQRMIAEIASASISGRLTGSLAGSSSADWFTRAAGGLGLPDVRIAIRTDDEAVVLMRYSGRLRFVPDAESVALIAPLFETGDPRYQWINDVQAAGKGIFSADRSRLDYEIYELQ
jgi:hypothetical protein